jgi:3-oxoacyl-[acyl-carrier protein] reductase
MRNELTGKIALVTGASKGIGAGIAIALAAAGASVAIGYGRDRNGAERSVSQIKDAGAKAIAVAADLTKASDAEAIVAKTVDAFGPIDILVNNAAVFEFKALAAIDETHVHRIFDANVLGLLNVTKFAIAKFNPAGGAVVNISSLSALGNGPASAVYSASKAAVNAITKVLALELAPRNIRVNAIMPGYFDTEGARAIGVKGSAQEAELIATTPLAKRPGVPSDLSPVAIFLASRASAWMTGEILTVSGGRR